MTQITLTDTVNQETTLVIERDLSWGGRAYVQILAEDERTSAEAEFKEDSLDSLTSVLNSLGSDNIEARVEDRYGDLIELVGNDRSLNVKVYDGNTIVVRLDADAVASLVAVVNGEEPPQPAPSEPQPVVLEPVEETGPTPEEVFEEKTEDHVLDGRTAFNAVAIQTAASYGLSISFRYAKSEDAPIETRSLRDVAVVHTEEGETLATGIDPDRDGVRAFRLDRIKGYVSVSD